MAYSYPQKRRKTIEKIERPTPTPTPTRDEESSQKYTCYRCGKEYKKLKGVFPTCNNALYGGVGYLPFCNSCIDDMYNEAVAKFGSNKLAMRKLCMNLDIYWGEELFEKAKEKMDKYKTPTTPARMYIGQTNLVSYSGKTYDTTIQEEYALDPNKVGEDGLNAFDKILAQFDDALKDGDLMAERIIALKSINSSNSSVIKTIDDAKAQERDNVIIGATPLEEITQEQIEFWGPGYTKTMYAELEQRKRYWLSELGEGLDIGTMALLRQICNLEIDINRDRSSGQSADKKINTLNTLVGSLNLKPSQRKDEIDSAIENRPLGVWLMKYEEGKPLPDIDPELQDTDGIIRYILIWVFGHLCKLLGIKNTYSKLYDDEIDKYRLEHPEYDDEEDDEMLYGLFGEEDGESSG